MSDRVNGWVVLTVICCSLISLRLHNLTVQSIEELTNRWEKSSWGHEYIHIIIMFIRSNYTDNYNIKLLEIKLRAYVL